MTGAAVFTLSTVTPETGVGVITFSLLKDTFIFWSFFFGFVFLLLMLFEVLNRVKQIYF